MIKAGQIYQENSWLYAVTHIESSMFPNMDRVFLILRNGSMMTEGVDVFKHEVVQGVVKLIAEYPTWQEAVNSKEFRE
ncbi:MAG: hypothetical protein IJ184_07385 [Alphaproteobacteria bacterium]|nr:hypothetical protein [Alphaproteobacteria bacterium]